MGAGGMTSAWYTDPAEVAALLRWLDDRCELRGVDDAIHVVEEPWSYTAEREQMVAEERHAEVLAELRATADILSESLRRRTT